MLLSVPLEDEDDYIRDRIAKHLNELSQAAGESWGHIWPK